jgi:pimeloyl-ACP methyl ester carboxylesterase
MSDIYKSEAGAQAIRERYLAFLARWPVPSQQVRILTREGETFVVASGDKTAPPLLLLHGSAANSTMWMADVAAWSAHFRVYAVDMIGEPGLSARSRPPLDSEAYTFWLDDVLSGLSVERASIAGVSLGGWLALDYATRRPERVESLALLCPGGVGRQKSSFMFKAIALSLAGAWGKRKLMQMVLGRAPANVPPAVQRFADFVSLIHQHFRPRRVKLPIFSEAALARLTMPVLAIVGGKDILLDSDETRRRLTGNVPHAEVRFLAEARHYIPAQTAVILDFLLSSALVPSQRYSSEGSSGCPAVP